MKFVIYSANLDNSNSRPCVIFVIFITFGLKDEHGDFDIDLSSVNNTNSTESTTTTAAVEQHHCEQCTYKTSLASALTYHMSARHGVGEYPCGKCDFMAATPAMLKSHKVYIFSSI